MPFLPKTSINKLTNDIQVRFIVSPNSKYAYFPNAPPSTIKVLNQGGAFLMPANKVSIVPVHLEPTSTKPSVSRTPLKPICVIQANQLKISFYHGVKNHVIQTIMQELTKHDT